MIYKNKMCDYSNIEGMLHFYGRGPRDNFWNPSQYRILRADSKWVRCPKCGRRLRSAVRYCHDGCCVYHCIPPHKIKRWWKKNKLSKKNKSIRRR
jgi:hypothetical protein